MTKYSGIFLRDTLGETNTLPRSSNEDTSSPDVINSGTEPATKPQTLYANSYAKYVGQDMVYGEQNHIYVRGKNYAPDQVVGNASLYWSYAKQLSHPGTWQQLVTASGSNSSSLAADANGIAVTATPFVWSPVKPSSGNPYVLIAVVSDPDNPDPVPDYQQSIDPSPFQEWQAEQGGVSALQLEVPTPPPSRPTYSFTGLLVLDNGEEQDMSFSLLVSNGVVGDQISCSLDAMDVNGNPMGVGNTQITQPDITIGFQGKVAAGYTGRATFEYTAADDTNPPCPTLTLQAAKLVSDSSGGGDDPFNPGGGNTKAVLVAQFVLQTKLPS